MFLSIAVIIFIDAQMISSLAGEVELAPISFWYNLNNLW